MYWNVLITMAVISLVFFLMMRHAVGCCGGVHSPAQGNRIKPSNTSETPPQQGRSPLIEVE